VIPGFGGHLLAEAFVEEQLAARGARCDGLPTRPAIAAWRRTTSTLGPASSLRAVIDVAVWPLLHLLGFQSHGHPRLNADHAVVEARARTATITVLVVPWGGGMRRWWRVAVAEATRADAAWAVVFNGTHLRLLRPARTHSRRYAELDLDAAADDDRAARVLSLLFSAGALGATDAAPGVRQLLADGERHAAGVCRALRRGVLDASTHVLRALARRETARPADDLFEQSLTIVYRLLFLLFAEARGLVPVWHPLYRASYSVEALREAALHQPSAGLWDGLRAIARLAHAGCRAGDLTVTAFNGRLFSPSRTPLAERRGLDDDEARQAIVAVSTRAAADGEGRERISYRDLGVEQLGAVYETLLDYEPHIDRAGRGRTPDVSLRSGSGVRKATGTFYTPQPLVDYLVRDTLGPLVRNAAPEQILERRVLDPSMGSGAFLVGACRYLAGAYETALVDAGRCHATDIGPSERASIHRLIAERCLFGVDLNPTAVQLARLSLWLTTLAADRPLTFLDHHLRTGDSLAGAWLSSIRLPPTPRRANASLPLFPESTPTDAVRAALPIRFALAHDPNDTAAQVRAKERALAALAAPQSALARWTAVADLWCASWLASPRIPAGAYAELSAWLLDERSALPAVVAHPLLDRARRTAAQLRLFHWELEFPEVFFDAAGARRVDAGFDAVIGNPPWDMIRADGSDRDRARTSASALVRFARDAGVYDVRSNGQVNRYQLFVERSLALTKPGGRLGLVLPWGIVGDTGSAALRRLLCTRADLERVIGFDNRRGTFPIHRSVKFVLVSATTGRATREIACRFGEADPTTLQAATGDDDRPAQEWFRVRVTPALLERISGEDLSIPDLQSSTDLAILERAATLFAPLGAREGWHARFGRELNATEDRTVLRPDGAGRPVYEGKSIEPFRLRADACRWSIAEADADELLGPRWRRARLAYRDVASPTNRVTLIAAVLPARTASTHTLFCLKTPLPLASQQILCALFNSFVVNFLVRLRVTTHVTTAIVERVPVPGVDRLGPMAEPLAADAHALARSHDPERFARVNARVARAYHLTAEEFAHVLSSFPLVERDERTRALELFRTLEA
jgi:hypothetical protein